VGLAAFALINIITALFAVLDPKGFYDAVGPFGAYNDHYIRDAAAAMQGSLGVAMAIAVLRRSWRVGVLGYASLHFLFHSINHLVDIGDADPEAMGPIDFATIGLTALVLGWLMRPLLADRREPVR
jgi:hypothetical protein